MNWLLRTMNRRLRMGRISSIMCYTPSSCPYEAPTRMQTLYNPEKEKGDETDS